MKVVNKQLFENGLRPTTNSYSIFLPQFNLRYFDQSCVFTPIIVSSSTRCWKWYMWMTDGQQPKPNIAHQHNLFFTLKILSNIGVYNTSAPLEVHVFDVNATETNTLMTEIIARSKTRNGDYSLLCERTNHLQPYHEGRHYLQTLTR